MEISPDAMIALNSIASRAWAGSRPGSKERLLANAVLQWIDAQFVTVPSRED